MHMSCPLHASPWFRSCPCPCCLAVGAGMGSSEDQDCVARWEPETLSSLILLFFRWEALHPPPPLDLNVKELFSLVQARICDTRFECASHHHQAFAALWARIATLSTPDPIFMRRLRCHFPLVGEGAEVLVFWLRHQRSRLLHSSSPSPLPWHYGYQFPERGSASGPGVSWDPQWALQSCEKTAPPSRTQEPLGAKHTIRLTPPSGPSPHSTPSSEHGLPTSPFLLPEAAMVGIPDVTSGLRSDGLGAPSSDGVSWESAVWVSPTLSSLLPASSSKCSLEPSCLPDPSSGGSPGWIRRPWRDRELWPAPPLPLPQQSLLHFFHARKRPHPDSPILPRPGVASLSQGGPVCGSPSSTFSI